MKLQKPKFFPLLFTIVTVVVLLMLGFWQLNRLQEKKILLSSIHCNLQNKPAIISALDSATIYSKVSIGGRFLMNYDTYLYRRITNHPGVDGYYLLSPFQTNDNQVILVVRGWFKSRYIQEVQRGLSQQPTQITGIILQSEHHNFLIPNKDLKSNVWFILDLAQISQSLKLNLHPYYLLQLEPKDLPEFISHVPTDNFSKIRNDHLEYAITWFSLALGLVIIFIIYHTKNS